jgi:hypothetical protein
MRASQLHHLRDHVGPRCHPDDGAISSSAWLQNAWASATSFGVPNLASSLGRKGRERIADVQRSHELGQ